ncbi:MAG: ABC transporter ATP-binding protein, partial [Candidatus Omnitrophota bacterium]|nr:ABC transporter ATP-binding protein [Candidatus Omnitrophota bacterium]
AIEFTNVWKKFRKGEKFNSLRDAIPNLFKREDSSLTLEDKEFWAVKDVSFNIEKGGVIGIMGPNGSGKSTTLKLLSRIMEPNKGDIKINGRLSALIEVTAGFHPELTGRENVYLNATILGMRKKEIDDKFDEIVEFSGVGEFIDTPVKRYSSGMYSRLGFSVAAHMEPDILLVDEVLSVGDIAFQAKCAQKIRELLKSGATIVLVSHQLGMIQSLCDRVILLQNGAVVRDGAVGDVIPLYQNIVLENREKELRHRMNVLNKQLKDDARPLMDITEVHFSKGAPGHKDTFDIGDSLELTLEYAVREQIDSPIFIVDLVRSDGVVCSHARSDEAGANPGILDGRGRLKIDLGKLYLAPGVYMAKLSVWDRNLIHTYVVRSKDILRIASNNRHSQTDAVLLPEIKWEFSG